MAAAKKMDSETWTFRLETDGAISNKKIELVALFMADGLTANAAWKHAGYRGNEGGSGQYQRRTLRNALFIERLRKLGEERDELVVDPIFGETEWMVRQMWRHARATNDPAMMAKATDLSWKITEKKAERIPQDAQAPGRAGKPSTFSPTSRADVSTLRAKLLAVGVKTEAPAVDVQDAAKPETPPPAPPRAVDRPDFDPSRYLG